MRGNDLFKISDRKSCYLDRISDWKSSTNYNCLSELLNHAIAKDITFEYYRSIRKGVISNLLYSSTTHFFSYNSNFYNAHYLGFKFFTKKLYKKERHKYGN